MSNKRILLIGPFNPGQLPASLARAFELLGYDVFRFDSDRAYFEAGRGAGNRVVRRALRWIFWNRLNLSTMEVARCVRPAFILAIKGNYLHPGTIRRLRAELAIPFGNYYADNPYCGVPLSPRKSSAQRRDLLDALRAYSRVWIWERGMAQRLAADGVAAAYLPFGVDPEAFRPVSPGNCSECVDPHAVVFIGQHSAKREAHVGAIRRQSVALWGSRWDRAAGPFKGRHIIHRRPTFGAHCAELYAAAAVSLNVVDDLNMPGHNMRSFEIPASGGLMLSTYTAEQAEFFPEDEAALYYRDPAEIDGKIERALKDQAWAAGLRRTALALTENQHYIDRVRAMTTELGV